MTWILPYQPVFSFRFFFCHSYYLLVCLKMIALLHDPISALLELLDRWLNICLKNIVPEKTWWHGTSMLSLLFIQNGAIFC